MIDQLQVAERPAANGLEDILARVREFAREELLPQQSHFDSFPEAPVPVCEVFHRLGLGNWWLPERYGGMGLGLEASVDLVSELAYGDAGVAFTLFISVLGTVGLSLYGNEELRERYLAPMTANGHYCATLASERAAGSELTKIATIAARDGDGVVINGEKFFSTNAGFANFLVVFARSVANPGEHLAVVVPRENPGVRVVKRWEMIGVRSSGTYQVMFERCRASAQDVLAGPGLRILEIALNASRILIASTALGIARRVRDICMEYARRKRVGDKPLVNNAVFAAKLGQMEMDIDAMRHVCLGAAREFDTITRRDDAAEQFLRRGTLKSALTAKTFCGRTGWQVASAGSEMFGGLGYTREMLIDKLVRDIRHVSIIEGGDDVLRDLVFNRYVLPGDNRV
ncbi:MAG TPA: acyl-CoA dehydrogenase family protein [Solirubrobacteraceae bacterium]|jgi:alkylation response protein AidB-like acyl-CoA dehydrogenase